VFILIEDVLPVWKVSIAAELDTAESTSASQTITLKVF